MLDSCVRPAYEVSNVSYVVKKLILSTHVSRVLDAIPGCIGNP